jgi:hypothetical protein
MSLDRIVDNNDNKNLGDSSNLTNANGNIISLNGSIFTKLTVVPSI